MRTIVFLTVSLALANQLAASEPLSGNVGDIQDIALIDVKPKLIKTVQPLYPYNQARAGVNGSVVVEFIINTQGQVQNPCIISSNNPAFERPALDSILQWKFSPGSRGGHPVNVRANQRMEFSLDVAGRDSGGWQITKSKNHTSLPPQLQWDIAPIPLGTTFPVYPLNALRAGLKGKTQLNFVVGPSGKVIKANVIAATTPEMGLAALAMIDTWQFTPAKKKDGTPMFAALAIEHSFEPSGQGDVPVTDAAHRILRLMQKHPEKIVGANELDQLPKPISRRPLVYPVALEVAAQPGSAVIEFIIDEEGDEQLPVIISSTAPEFGYAAVQAVAAWRFEPAKKNGQTVISRARLPINFKPAPAPAISSNP